MKLYRLKKPKGQNKSGFFFVCIEPRRLLKTANRVSPVYWGFFYISGKRKTVDPQLHDPKTRFCVPFSLVVKPHQFARAFLKKKKHKAFF